MFEDAIASLNRGDVIAVPTEAVYGLSVDPQNISAIEKLLKMKNRNPDKGFILVASDFSQLESYIRELTPNLKTELLSRWPGPTTWVVPAKDSVPFLIKGNHETVAVRVTSHPTLSKLCVEFGRPLISTSANVEGEPPAVSEQTVRDYFGKDILIVPGTVGTLGRPTEIRDARTGKVIRA